MTFSAVVLRRPAAALAALAFAFLPVAPAMAADKPSDPVVWGQQLFAEGCASCHGLKGEGAPDAPALVDVGAAGTHFVIATGRMPMATLAAQSMRRPKSMYNEDETLAIASFVATLGDGPAIPTTDVQGWENADVAMGGEVFRTNCAQCHSFSGQGGALTQGKQAPNLMKATPTEIYEAMLFGPNNMPAFSDATIPPAEKRAVIKYIDFLRQPVNPGGLDLGRLGPVSEGLFGWVAGFGVLVVVAIWIGVKAK